MMTLKQRIIRHIQETGPMTIAAYMAWCLLDPKQGFYPTRDPLGTDGDFITAPEISQMFGEVLGLWLLNAWRSMGCPGKVYLIEFGPGRGVMMSDIIRTANLDKDFTVSLDISLIETSSALMAKQAQTLGDTAIPVNWIDHLDQVEPGPTLIIGNEYLDCLPLRQFIMQDRFAGNAGWHERLVGIHPDNPDKLVYSIAAAPIAKADQALIPAEIPDVKNGDLLEVNTGLMQLCDTLKARFKDHPGAALFLDYGPGETEFGDTFQAIKRHKKTHPLLDPGQADLTARVDFSALTEWAKTAGLAVYGPTTQSAFLSKLGIEVRAVTLSRSNPGAKTKIARQLHRLMDTDEMGTLFKAISLQSPSLPMPLGFEQ